MEVSAIQTAFTDYFPKVFERLQGLLKGYPEVAIAHINEMLNYTISGGKGLRGLLVPLVFLDLTKISPNDPRAEISYILGWSIEIIHAALLIADDYMDNSTTRRGKQCWYLRDGIGSSSINDTVILENVGFLLINSIRSELPLDTYNRIYTTFRKNLALTCMGQTIDVATTNPEFQSYDLTVTHKTTHYTFTIPIDIGIILSQKVDFSLLQDEIYLCLIHKIGYQFQAQDDWLDVYGNEKVTGKIGTDIADGKLSWLACKAMELSNDNQKDLLRSNFGKKDEASVKIVKDIFDALKVSEEFLKFATESGEQIDLLITKLNPTMPVNAFRFLMKVMSNRTA